MQNYKIEKRKYKFFMHFLKFFPFLFPIFPYALFTKSLFHVSLAFFLFLC